MRRMILALAFGALTTSPANAGGVNLAWSECLGGGGFVNRNFACNTNAGTSRLVVSFVANEPMPNVVGHEVRIDLQSADAMTLNPWWQMFAPGSCRGAAVPSVDVVPPSVGCVDFWVGGGSGGVGSYTIHQGTRATLRVSWADAIPRPVDDVNEYYSLNIVIPNTATVGTPRCAGCATDVCLGLTHVVLVGQEGNLQLLNTPASSNYVKWQSGGWWCPFPDEPPIPTRENTWGQIKSMYR